ncbi:MAG: phosphoribosyltransferase [Chloroflexi bacterium]|nr:phosphoribosyltransferase [Chloroflexota bacterium]
MANVYLTWQDVEELISKVVMQLNTPYDSLLLITRGGIIPGGMIAEALKMKDVLTASVVFGQDSTLRAEMSWPRFQQFPTEGLLQGKKILVVDNVWDRGRTIVTVASRIAAAGGYPETAVLHWKQNRSLFKDDEPDYYAEITDDWIYYPWQRIDDSGDLVPGRPLVPQLS